MVCTVKVKQVTEQQVAALRRAYEPQCAYLEEGVRRLKHVGGNTDEELPFWRGLPHTPTRFISVEFWQQPSVGQVVVACYNLSREEGREALWRLLDELEDLGVSAVDFGPNHGPHSTHMIDVIRDQYPIKGARF